MMRRVGSAVQKQAAGVGRTDGIECWEEAEPTTFMVRGQCYMQDKKKVPSEHSIYRQAVASLSCATRVFQLCHSGRSPQGLILIS